ncbi:MAG: hypothetical protein H6706_27675 [Myxococcales bacterium]|nr:hypothetical protein [Myxococcales bacterium]
MGLPRLRSLARLGIWGFALGYFLAYVPYSALTKALSGGHLASYPEHVSGFELLPISALASLVAMFIAITVLGWWQHASRLRVGRWSIPFPGRWTFLSGLCTAGIIATTTLAYTFEGVSIVFMMLLMRGGLLVLAPIVDKVTGRRVRWFSWAALAMSMGALLVAFSSDAGFAVTATALADVFIYLLSYFVRLRFMSKIAKSDDPVVRARYFVEEQMVATPAMVAVLVVLAFIDHGQFSHDIRAGFTTFFDRPIVLQGILVGLFSQGTGIFGGLILLDGRENSFCIPVNRASSILAGVAASYVLVAIGLPAPDASQLLGASLIVGAIGFLSIPPLLEKRRARRAL